MRTHRVSSFLIFVSDDLLKIIQSLLRSMA